MAFQGSLKELPLPDIIQLVAVSRKSGVFSIEDGGSRGKIVLRDGQIVDAEVGDLRGEEAVYELSIWPDGRFQFDPDSSAGSESPTIQKSNTNLLMEAARRKDEWRILAKKIPSIRTVPYLPGGDAVGSLNPREETVAAQIDGLCSIEAIGLKLDQSPFEVAKVVYGLVTSGTAALRDPASPTPSAAVAPSSGARFDHLSERQEAELTTAIFASAFELLESRESLSELEALRAKAAREDHPLGATGRITDLVNGAQTLISDEQDATQAGAFLERVEDLFKEV